MLEGEGAQRRPVVPFWWRPSRAVLAVALALALAEGYFRVALAPLPYDCHIWMQLQPPTGMGGPPPGWNNLRARMVEDLLARHLYVGMPWPEVKELLGRPDAEGEDDWYWSMLWAPRPDQAAYARLRWGTAHLYLELDMTSGPRSRTAKRIAVNSFIFD